MSERAFNPIIGRELVGLVNSPKALAVQIALAISFTLLVAIRWPSDSMTDISGERAVEVFRVFGYGLLVALLLFVPAFPAVSIVKERHKGTLALLFNSPMSPLSIYFGKFLGVFLFVSMLLSLSLPAVAACYSMGGLDWWSHVGKLYLVLVLMLAQYVATGLWVSSHSGSPDAAMRMSYLTIALLSSVTLIPHFFYFGTPGTTAMVCDWIRCISPVAAVMEIMGHGGVGGRGLAVQETVALRFCLLSALLTAGFAIATITRLNYRIFDRSRSQGVITDDLSTSKRVARGLFYIVDPQRRKAGIRFINPIFVKEFRTRRFGRMHWILRLVSFCAIGSIGLTFVSLQQSQVFGVREVGGILVMLQVLLILLLVPSTTAGLIAAERESGGWVLLQLTPLWALRIVSGKLSSAFVTVGVALLGTLPGYVTLVWVAPEIAQEVMGVLISLLCTSIFAVASSAFVSSLFKRTAPATATAYGVLIVIFIGTLLVWLGRDAPFGYGTVQAALMINPVAGALAEMGTYDFETYRLLPWNWIVSLTLSLLCLIGLGIRVQQINRPA